MKYVTSVSQAKFFKILEYKIDRYGGEKSEYYLKHWNGTGKSEIF